MNEQEFGHQFKRKLDQALDLEPTTLNRLKLAREHALSRQRVTEPVFVLALADAVVGRLSGNPASVSIVLAGAALILALVGIHYWQQQPSVEEIEEIDAAILTGDLPVSAYIDKSFDTWLKRSQY
jgi:hypothetical protein